MILSNEKINNLRKLEDEINDTINNSNLINGNLIITKINSEIQNLVDFPLVIIGDSFYNKKSNADNTYNKLIDYEKKISTKLLEQNKGKIINSILNNDKLASISKIENKIIQQITTNEESINFIKDKIIKEIKVVAENEQKFKINNLNILLVGRHGIGKTSLINYILGCNCIINLLIIMMILFYIQVKKLIT